MNFHIMEIKQSHLVGENANCTVFLAWLYDNAHQPLQCVFLLKHLVTLLEKYLTDVFIQIEKDICTRLFITAI